MYRFFLLCTIDILNSIKNIEFLNMLCYNFYIEGKRNWGNSMEMMNYNKINGKKSNVALGFFLSFAVLGSTAVGYLLATEKEDVVNFDAYKDVEVYQEEKVDIDSIQHAITIVSKTEKDSMYKADIWMPSVSVDGVSLDDINAKIKDKFLDKYEALKLDSEDTLENEMTYKVRYKEYVNKVEDTKILSLVIDEKIIDVDGKIFSNRLYTYNIDMVEHELVYQDDIGPKLLGYDYRNVIKSTIKQYALANKYVTNEEYNYTYTGLEEYYVMGGKFHFVINPGDLYDKEYGIMDITVEK